MEAFFSGILLKYRDKQSLIFSVIDGSCHAEQFRKLSEEAYPKMTPINAALKNATIWDAVKIEFNLPTTLRLPNFRNQLLYGVMSERLHDPDIMNIIVSDKSYKEYKEFFMALCDIVDTQYSEFDEESAEAID